MRYLQYAPSVGRCASCGLTDWRDSTPRCKSCCIRALVGRGVNAVMRSLLTSLNSHTVLLFVLVLRGLHIVTLTRNFSWSSSSPKTKRQCATSARRPGKSSGRLRHPRSMSLCPALPGRLRVYVQVPSAVRSGLLVAGTQCGSFLGLTDPSDCCTHSIRTLFLLSPSNDHDDDHSSNMSSFPDLCLGLSLANLLNHVAYTIFLRKLMPLETKWACFF